MPRTCITEYAREAARANKAKKRLAARSRAEMAVVMTLFAAVTVGFLVQAERGLSAAGESPKWELRP